MTNRHPIELANNTSYFILLICYTIHRTTLMRLRSLNFYRFTLSWFYLTWSLFIEKGKKDVTANKYITINIFLHKIKIKQHSNVLSRKSKYLNCFLNFNFIKKQNLITLIFCTIRLSFLTNIKSFLTNKNYYMFRIVSIITWLKNF